MTQTQRIIQYLEKPGRRLTPLKALKLFDCWALSSRMSDIRKLQGKINRVVDTKFVKTKSGKIIAEYSFK